MPEPGIPGTIRLLKTKAIVSTARKCQVILFKRAGQRRPALLGGIRRGVRRPLCGHLDTASGGKARWAAHLKHRREESAAPLNRVLELACPGAHWSDVLAVFRETREG